MIGKKSSKVCLGHSIVHRMCDEADWALRFSALKEHRGIIHFELEY